MEATTFDLHYVSVKMPSAKRALLLSSGGYLNALRVHAVRFGSHAEADKVAREIESENPGFTACAIKPRPVRRRPLTPIQITG